MKHDVIIIGAGAAGLMAASTLLKAGYRVCLLEAATVAGGRIATIQENGFSTPVETGAEFVHGKLPLTLKLLNKANIDYSPIGGKMVSVQHGKWHKSVEHNKQWELFIQQLRKLKTDISIGQMLSLYFSSARYASLRNAVKRFAEGFDLADTGHASALAAQQEWGHEDDEQYRITGGYVQLINYLLATCVKQQATIHYNAIVASIEYSKNGVSVFTTDNRQFHAARVIITVSAGVLQAGQLKFVPALDARYTKAIQQIGFGDVIKILLQFKTAFWTKQSADIGFFISDEAIPTWWTQLPATDNLLTGWLGGPNATTRSGDSEEDILQSALQSLSGIFNVPVEDIRAELVHHKISCWRNHNYVKGGYSYVTTESAKARKVLAHPADDVLFFAGEAMHRGTSQGTVEAALQSGKLVAKMIKDDFPLEKSRSDTK